MTMRVKKKLEEKTGSWQSILANAMRIWQLNTDRVASGYLVAVEKNSYSVDWHAELSPTGFCNLRLCCTENTGRMKTEQKLGKIFPLRTNKLLYLSLQWPSKNFNIVLLNLNITKKNYVRGKNKNNTKKKKIQNTKYKKIQNALPPANRLL